MKEKVIIFSAPSGSGKSTIVNHLLKLNTNLEFSISATSRNPRGKERDGKEYYFLTTEDFENKIKENAFIEYEEVYKGSYYGTLKSEVNRIWQKDHIILFDIDVKGGVNLKRLFKDKALSVFVKPPSIEVLRQRLTLRQTDNEEAINKRISKAQEELTYENKFDYVLVNDDLNKTLTEAEKLLKNFMNK
ncbi:MAG: guanylate kinase [Bacteroidales bacterium]